MMISSLFLTAVFGVATTVNGHGFMSSPRSRQVFSAEDGVQSGNSNADVLPRVEYCPHCHLVGGDTYGVCGRRAVGSNNNDYTTNWVTGSGNPMPFTPQATYQEGQIIEVESILSANHIGHFQMGICTNVDAPTQACFDANRLEFVDDPLYGAPKDPDYPDRAYLRPESADATIPGFSDALTDVKAGVQGVLFRHRFKLPMGVTGDKVLLQWHWLTNLGCRNVGYLDYDWPAGWTPWGNQNDICYPPLPDIGNDPQQYWQCAEIVIQPAGPQPPSTSPTPNPTSPPTIDNPDTSPPMTPNPTPNSNPSTPNPTPPPTPVVTNNGGGCCTMDFTRCLNSADTCSPVDRCGIANGCQHYYWNSFGEPTGSCVGRWNGCASQDCCPGLECKVRQADSYLICLAPDEDP